jgi:hypothetical protein
MLAGGCGRLPETCARARVPRPDSIPSPWRFQRELCRIRADGSGAGDGACRSLYLSIADDSLLRSVIAKRRPGTAMSAFSQKEGRMLTDEQIDSIVRGIRSGGKHGSDGRGSSYETTAHGDARQGEPVLRRFCGVVPRRRRPRRPARARTDPAYLSLITDQGLGRSSSPAGLISARGLGGTCLAGR